MIVNFLRCAPGALVLLCVVIADGASASPRVEEVRTLLQRDLRETAWQSVDGMVSSGDVTVAEGRALIRLFADFRDRTLLHRFMERALVLFPADAFVQWTCAHQRRTTLPTQAAECAMRAALLDASYAPRAVELLREASRMREAWLLLPRVADDRVRLKQRLALLLDDKQYDAMVAAIPRAERLSLTRDDNIRYALAYAAFVTGEPSRAERLLQNISDAAVFQKAADLMQAVARCRAEGLWCAP